MNLREFAQFYRLTRRRLRSQTDYRNFQAFQAGQLIGYLEGNGVQLPGRTLLDLGSGIGGYSREFIAYGARVVSVDLVQLPLPHDFKLGQVQGSAFNVPLQAESVDVVFCASLIEHVTRPIAILNEAERVLKRGGACYMSFPPYYNPTGGHEYAPFHYLGERVAMRLVRRRAVVPQWVYQYYALSERPTSFADLSTGWGLYRMTIRKFRRLVACTSMRMTNVSTRYLPMSFVRWPLVGEVLTWHAQFLLVKP